MKNKWNDPATYACVSMQLSEANIAVHTPAFAYIEGERLVRKYPEEGFFYDEEKVKSQLTDIDYSILCRVAASKYLTAKQVHEFMCLEGYDEVLQRRDIIEKHLQKQVKYRLLKKYELVKPGMEKGLVVYACDMHGANLAYSQGVYMHAGNKYLSPKRRQELGLSAEDLPVELKRCLVANQLAISALKSQLMLDSFTIRQTMRLKTEDSYETANIVRFPLTLRIDPENILVFEVVRRNGEASYEMLENKLSRYGKLLSTGRYVSDNAYGDCAEPQLVLVGEDFEHNKELAHFLREKDPIGVEDLTVLFTEDLLHMNNTAHQSLYEITEEGERLWYEIPRNAKCLGAYTKSVVMEDFAKECLNLLPGEKLKENIMQTEFDRADRKGWTMSQIESYIVENRKLFVESVTV